MKRFAEDNAALMVEAHRLLAENALLREELGLAPAEGSDGEATDVAPPQPAVPSPGDPPMRIQYMQFDSPPAATAVLGCSFSR